VCGTTSNTVITTKTCATGQYASGFTQGTSTTLGTQGTCTNCTTPSATQYVNNVCTFTTNTVLATKQTCASGQYLSGFNQGTVNATGSPGTCTTCSRPTPATLQYVTGLCSGSTDTVISTKSCPAGQYVSGFTQGIPTALGTQGACTACSNPGPNQYVSSICTSASNTVVASKTCGSGQQLSSPGSYSSVGSATCSPCNTVGLSNCATCPSTTQYWNGTVCKQCVVDTNCLTGSSCSSGSCTTCVTTGSATCPTCPAGTPYWSGTLLGCKACMVDTNCPQGKKCSASKTCV